MIALTERVAVVLEEAWGLLPPLKEQLPPIEVQLTDLGMVHGQYTPSTSTLTLSERIFWGTVPEHIRHIDRDGNDPPQSLPTVSRMLHTTLHEWMHAIGYEAGLDDAKEWLALSGWVRADDDPVDTRRYWERRPGWSPHGPSEWRYRSGAWFPRFYSSKTPYEDFADCCTHEILGWLESITHPNGRAKRQWLRREVWGEVGARRLQASRERWRGQMQAVKDQWTLTHSTLDKSL